MAVNCFVTDAKPKDRLWCIWNIVFNIREAVTVADDRLAVASYEDRPGEPLVFDGGLYVLFDLGCDLFIRDLLRGNRLKNHQQQGGNG